MTRSVDLCVVGTLAFDDVETPAGRRDAVLGGSATYFSVAASHFARVGVVGVVGADFPDWFRDVLTALTHCRRHCVDAVSTSQSDWR